VKSNPCVFLVALSPAISEVINRASVRGGLSRRLGVPVRFGDVALNVTPDEAAHLAVAGGAAGRARDLAERTADGRSDRPPDNVLSEGD
jgi:hypothetical protein